MPLFIHQKSLLNAYLPDHGWHQDTWRKRLSPCPQVALGRKWKNKLVVGFNVMEMCEAAL